MSITYTGNSTSAVSALQDACNRDSASQIVTISRATPDRIQTWAASNLAAGTSVNLTNNSSASTVTMLSSASACIWTSTTNMDVVNLDTGYKANYTGIVATRTATKGQQSAALQDYGIAIATTTSNNTVNKFLASSFAASTATITAMNGFPPTCIIALASSFLIGTEAGTIIEVDSTLAAVKTFQIPSELDFSSSDRMYISGLSYYNGIVLANTSVGTMYQIDWLTLDVLNIMPVHNSSSTASQGATLCTTASGVACFGIFNTGTGNKPFNFVTAIDYRVTPPKIDDVLFLNTAQNIIQTGQINGIGWAIYQNSTIVNFSLVPTTMTTQTPSIYYSAQYHQGQRILIIDDGNTRIESDIVLPANNTTTFTVTPGKTVIDAAFVNTGVDKLGSVSRYST